MNFVKLVSPILLVLGAINWGLVGVLDMNIIDILFGGLGESVHTIIYGLIGLSGIHHIMQGNLFE